LGKRSRAECELHPFPSFAPGPDPRGRRRQGLAVPGSRTQHPVGGELAAASSNGVVRLLSEYTGRGPTRARTYIDRDVVTVVLEDMLTKGERSLVQDGESALVLAARKAYQRTMADDLVALVEELTGRKVRAFLSDNHIEPDIAAETFLLEPIAVDAVDGDGHRPS